jgi:hypothetical protein
LDIRIEERLEVDAFGQCVNDDGFFRARHLDDAEQGVVGRFPQELGVDGNDAVLASRAQTSASSEVVVIR